MGAEGLEQVHEFPGKKQPSLLHTQSFNFFICIIKWVFKEKNEYVNHNGARRKESINLMVNSQILKNYFKYYVHKAYSLFFVINPVRRRAAMTMFLSISSFI